MTLIEPSRRAGTDCRRIARPACDLTTYQDLDMVKKHRLTTTQKFIVANLLSAWRERIENNRISRNEIAKELTNNVKFVVTDANLKTLCQEMPDPPKFYTAKFGGGGTPYAVKIKELQDTIARMKSELGMTW
jgi:hypothetical protein